MRRAKGRGGFALWVAAAALLALGWPPGALAGTAGDAAPTVPRNDFGPRQSYYFAEALGRQPPPAPEKPKPRLRRMRTNAINLGLQITYGGVGGSSRIGEGFSSGIGYAFRFRYQMKPSFALGISFESQRFDANSNNPPSTEPDASDSTVNMTTVSGEAVFYVNRQKETNPYFITGIGIASPDVVDENLGSARVDDGPFLVLGAGLEHFIRDRFSIDLALRGYGLASGSEFTTMYQVCAGIQLYPGE
jgi:opacity protein-like surface antigen